MPIDTPTGSRAAGDTPLESNSRPICVLSLRVARESAKCVSQKCVGDERRAGARNSKSRTKEEMKRAHTGPTLQMSVSRRHQHQQWLAWSLQFARGALYRCAAAHRRPLGFLKNKNDARGVCALPCAQDPPVCGRPSTGTSNTLKWTLPPVVRSWGSFGSWLVSSVPVEQQSLSLQKI